jgi:hypothetical protein
LFVEAGKRKVGVTGFLHGKPNPQRHIKEPTTRIVPVPEGSRERVNAHLQTSAELVHSEKMGMDVLISRSTSTVPATNCGAARSVTA